MNYNLSKSVNVYLQQLAGWMASPTATKGSAWASLVAAQKQASLVRTCSNQQLPLKSMNTGFKQEKSLLVVELWVYPISRLQNKEVVARGQDNRTGPLWCKCIEKNSASVHASLDTFCREVKAILHLHATVNYANNHSSKFTLQKKKMKVILTKFVEWTV